MYVKQYLEMCRFSLLALHQYCLQVPVLRIYVHGYLSVYMSTSQELSPATLPSSFTTMSYTTYSSNPSDVRNVAPTLILPG